jgi:MFS family permease
MTTTRTLTEDDANDARAMFGWQFWAPPVIFTIGYFIAAWFALELGWAGEVICFLLLGGLAIYAWINSVSKHRKLSADLGKRLVNIVEGAPERVFMTRFGRCYVRMSGQKIRIGNEYFSELRDANRVHIEFLPESLVAVRVEIARGIGA